MDDPRGEVPEYIRAAKPNSPENRAAWHKNTAPTYAGIFLWFVFWDSIAGAGLPLGGLAATLGGIAIAALCCYALFYRVPALLGMETGLPLYIVGTSTFGAVGGLLMPGFLMGALQFGWLAVSTFAAAKTLAGSDHSVAFLVLCVVWATGAALVGLKGIRYVSKVATFLPLVPLGVLLYALVRFGSAAPSYQPAPPRADGLAAVFGMISAIVGFFATAGAAGVDFGTNARDARDVKWGGIAGILIAIVFTAGAATIAVAGAHASNILSPGDPEPFALTAALRRSTAPWLYGVMATGLSVAAFPGACFSSFIAANSFKTVMPRVSSTLSVGLGAFVSIVLAVTGVASDLPKVFIVIGASFGPICGAMSADYLIEGRRWSGPRKGFNPAGWIAWLCGFAVGITPNLHALDARISPLPAAPLLAFLIGASVYFVLAKLGARSALRIGPNWTGGSK